MRGSNKSKRVSWPPDVKLCQVRLFLSEESPSQVGLGVQDHLQEKSSWPSHPSDGNLPPGFDGSHSAGQSQIKLAEIPIIKWKFPIRFVLNLDWEVVTGEESNEVEAQNQRELRVLEAFYPGASAIPPNPSVSVDVENPDYNDQQTPLIPITPIEDEETPIDTSSDFTTKFNVLVCPQPSQTTVNVSPGSSRNTQPDIMAATSAALSAISKSEQGNMIDQDLLIKILSNPKLVENLVANYGPGLSDTPKLASPPVTLPNQPPVVTLPNQLRPVTLPAPPSIHEVNGQFYPHPNGTNVPPQGISSVPPPQGNFGISQVKDANYYKNLIQQHGGERQEPVQQFGFRYNHQLGGGPNQEMGNNSLRPSKPKIMKPCIYFNSSRGCRHGANCAYQHDVASYQPRNPNSGNAMSEVQNAKRMKFDREISS